MQNSNLCFNFYSAEFDSVQSNFPKTLFSLCLLEDVVLQMKIIICGIIHLPIRLHIHVSPPSENNNSSWLICSLLCRNENTSKVMFYCEILTPPFYLV